MGGNRIEGEEEGKEVEELREEEAKTPWFLHSRPRGRQEDKSEIETEMEAPSSK